MKNEEINQRISELKGHLSKDGPYCQCTTDDDGDSIHGYCWDNEGFKDIHPIGGCWSCRKPRNPKCAWTGDEALNAELLEEMPEPELWLESSKGEPRLWCIQPDIMQEEPHKNPNYVCECNSDRKTAIALAWLKWKESTPRREK